MTERTELSSRMLINASAYARATGCSETMLEIFALEHILSRNADFIKSAVPLSPRPNMRERIPLLLSR